MDTIRVKTPCGEMEGFVEDGTLTVNLKRHRDGGDLACSGVSVCKFRSGSIVGIECRSQSR